MAIDTTLTNEEIKALMRSVVQRVRADLFAEACDCPLHRLTKEQRAESIDKAIDLTNEQIRNGTFDQDIEGSNEN